MLIDETLLDEVLAALDAPTLKIVHDLFEVQSQVLASTASDRSLNLLARGEAAHALKGLALQFGLEELCEVLSGLETACQNNDALAVNGYSEKLDAVLTASCQALNRFLLARV